MFSTRFAIPIGAFVALAALAFPGVSSANTGSVKCDSTGVVFSYRANFNPSRVSTETVNGVSQQFTVPKWTAVTHTWPGLYGTLTVGATWQGGQIKTVTLYCPTPLAPPQPVAPPPVPVAPPAVVTPPAPAPVPAVVTPPAPPAAPAAPAVTPATSSAPAPKVSLRKRALAKIVAAGSTVRYQLIVKATGGTAHDVVVCDKLPAHMTYASLGIATLQNGKACWVIAELTGSLTLSLTAKVDKDAPAGTLTNNATATSSDSGSDKASANVKVPAKHGVKGKLKRSAGVTG
jgi:uncharacterized repeat protein (TIGR01451 family)